MTKNKKYLLLSLSTLALLSVASCSSGGASAEGEEAVQDSTRIVELAVGASTVKTHVSALLDKFGVTNRVQLAVAVAECAVDDVAR